ncbi:MAG: triphosphoribosyl-dephospho-CoA synthase [Bacteroidales bacterium]|nr:triphosphoribosyl-dephospho-CoA synthase [Bacteroidales bacterium]
MTDIQEMPLSVPHFRRKVEDFLGRNGLRLEDVDVYLSIQDPEGEILAGGGLKGDVIKCVAVSESARSQGLSAPLFSRLISIASERGITNLKAFTKPKNESVFASLGFHTLAYAPKAILMENGRGLESYLEYLGKHRKNGRNGAIVMNANPFTNGHQYLVRNSSQQVDNLYVIPVREDVSRFPYRERLQMMESGCDGLAEVLEGSAYQVSSATFPTYFLKDLSDASETQMRLDLDLFGRHIAPALGITVRFAGSEPADPLTARYNELMKEMLPSYGIDFCETERLCDDENHSGTLHVHHSHVKSDPPDIAAIGISASRVRKALDEGRLPWWLVPSGTWPYLVAEAVSRSMRMELDAPFKPGLVDPGRRGAHTDMDYSLMKGSIDVIRRSFTSHSDKTNPVAFGKAVESDVMEYTGGVNTYRGAIFCQLTMAMAFLDLISRPETDTERLPELLPEAIARLASQVEPSYTSNGGRAVKEYGVKGALAMALGGYRELFGNWLPFYRSVKGDEWGLQKTLLLIMSSLDDTCIIHRAGYPRAQEVKAEASELLRNFSPEGLEAMDEVFLSERISPGGCADMLALTLLADNLLN